MKDYTIVFNSVKDRKWWWTFHKNMNPEMFKLKKQRLNRIHCQMTDAMYQVISDPNKMILYGIKRIDRR